MLKKNLQNKNIILAVIPIVILITGIGGWYLYSSKQTDSKYVFAIAKKGDLIKQIKTDGLIKASQELSLSFERSGKIAKVNVKTGDAIKAGQVLVELENNDVKADLSQVSASVQMAESQLKQLEAVLDLQKIKKDEMLRGARQEDVQITETKLDNANRNLQDAQLNFDNVKAKTELDYNNAVSNIVNLLQDASAKSVDAVNRQTDEMFSNPNTLNPLFSIETPLNYQAKLDVQSQRVKANSAVEALSSMSLSLNSDYSNYDQIAGNAINELQAVRNYLTTVNSALKYTVLSPDLTQTKLNFYNSNINSSLTSINAMITSLTNYRQSVAALKATNKSLILGAEMKVNDAKNSLASVSDELNLKKAGATKEQLSAQDALINQAQYNVDTQRAQINAVRANAYRVSTQFDKTVIKSPIDGKVAKFDLNVGESVSSNVPIISLMSAAKFQIESFVAEADISSVKVGDMAEITLDAQGENKYQAKVIMIDLAATMNNGNPTYKVTLEFVEDNESIKSGLTANVNILAGQEKDVIIISKSSIIKEGNEQYVIVKNETAVGEKRKIETGGIVQDGKIGVISGLNENEEIADFSNIIK